MKILKRVLVVCAILLALPFIIALFLKTTFVVEREITIHKPRQAVFEYVKHLKHQQKYASWAQLDPQTKFSYRGEDGTVGFVMGWDSADQNVGLGEQEITKIVEGERIEVEIRFTRPFQSTNPAHTIVESVAADKTRVKTIYFGKINYPLNLLCPMIENKIGTGMASSLDSLKELVEK